MPLSAMAERLARIYGTEEDRYAQPCRRSLRYGSIWRAAHRCLRTDCADNCRVNCPFYHKIGACRHGERCSRLHNKPTFSQTILLSHMYQSPFMMNQDGMITQENESGEKKFFEEFYEEVRPFFVQR